ncbi:MULTISPECIES: VanZ family protein [Priestia]|nr:VanZ family protein [Priestia aryabhattai]
MLDLSVTCLIEFIQYFMGRSLDIDDVLLNMFGTVISYVVLLINKQAGKIKKGDYIDRCPFCSNNLVDGN